MVVDTNVWGAELDARSAPLRHRYARHLIGTSPAIAVQTVVELPHGTLKKHWGERRLDQLCCTGPSSSRSTTVSCGPTRGYGWRVDRPVMPFMTKAHDGDLWVAASAVAHGLPLVTDDRVFARVPGLTAVTEPA